MNNTNSNQNDFLEFYGEHNISPVEQDISEIDVHYTRREKLYRQLGMPKMIFEGKEVLEVGPGGGYNSIAFFHWNVKHLDLVEANPKGISDMKALFSEHNIDATRYTIIESIVEKYDTEKKYDIVIAESFLQYLKNQQEVIDKLKALTKPGGIVVITCSDDTCFYIEQMKRVIAHALTKDIDDYDAKVDYLANIFGPQLDRLRGVSRSAKSWVQDQLLNPVAVNGTSLSLIEAIHKFGDNCDVLSSAPRVFTDHSWYKDIWHDIKSDYENQFKYKGINLVMASMPDEILLTDDELGVNDTISEIKKCTVKFEKEGNFDYFKKILEGNIEVRNKLKGKSGKLDLVLSEIVGAFSDIVQYGIDDFAFDKYPNFMSAFGKTQQYMSFIVK